MFFQEIDPLHHFDERRFAHLIFAIFVMKLLRAINGNPYQPALIRVDAPGMYTTIQDIGRIGFQQYGMPVAGPMDSESYLLGQALVGNKEPLGALECTVLPPTLTVQGTCIVAFTGADMHPTISRYSVWRIS